jgi:hypothetical protein
MEWGTLFSGSTCQLNTIQPPFDLALNPPETQRNIKTSSKFATASVSWDNQLTFGSSQISIYNAC